MLRARFTAALSLGSTAIGGNGFTGRRLFETRLPEEGEFESSDRRRWLPSRIIGELVLEELDLAMEWLLVVRSKGTALVIEEGAGADADGTAPIVISSIPKSGNQSLATFAESSVGNNGEVSKLLSSRGESLISGDVKFVKAEDAGAGVKGSLKMSRGDTVRADPGVTATGLIAVKAVAVKSKLSIAW